MSNIQFTTDMGSLSKAPQDGFQNITSDYTSVFGTFTNDYLKGIPVHVSEENPETPFSYNNFMSNVFEDKNDFPKDNYDDYYCDDDDEVVSSLEFEC